MDRETRLVCGGLAAFLVFAWWAHAYHYGLEAAWKGFGPIGYVYQSAEPESFARNFPGGTEAYDASAIMLGYRLAYRAGIEPETMVPIVIGFEILLLAAAAVLFLRALRPAASPALAALLVVLVVASSARDMSLARFGQPFIIGQFYNFAEVLRLLAIVAVLRGRPLASAACLAATFVIHPTLALIGAAFVGGAMLIRPREIVSRRAVAGAVLFLAVSAGWAVGVVGLGAPAAEPLPLEEWVALTRMGNHHWYPVDLGVFTRAHEDRFVPFLMLTALGLHYAGRGRIAEADRRVLAGCATMGVLVVAGLLVSVLAPSPMLIKLALHRAGDLIILVMLVYAADGLWSDVGRGGWRGGVAALILLSPMLARPGFPALVAMPLLLPPRGSRVSQAGTVVGAVTLLLIEGYALAGMAGPWSSHAYTGVAPVLATGWPALAAVVVICAAGVWARRVGPRPVLGLAAAAGALWLWQSRTLSGETEAARAEAYLEAQVWARENTARDALVMPDPTLYYGWRDYSRRSSFGNLREWLHTAWLYRWDRDVYREGMRRFREFGIELGPYLRYKPALSGYYALTGELRERYYTADEAWYRYMAGKYGIDYFVHLKYRVRRRLELPVAYENDGVIIYAPYPSPRGSAVSRLRSTRAPARRAAMPAKANAPGAFIATASG